ncbi:MAG: hypothetical protein ACREDV_06255 [Methylocella sp.]
MPDHPAWILTWADLRNLAENSDGEAFRWPWLRAVGWSEWSIFISQLGARKINAMSHGTDAMNFSNEFLDKLKKSHREAARKYQDLAWSYLTRNYRDPQAREYAVQGFSRRLKALARCIDNVFRTLPPDRIDLPSRDEISDATINIQAFVFNVFGSIDNLAWIWVQEKPVRCENGSPIPNNWVGLAKDNRFVRSSLSTEFQQYLKGSDDWFDQLGNFRHALAHRIPLYIPPYVVPQSKLPIYRQLQDRITEAEKQKNFVEANRVRAEQEALGTFKPVMTHSFEEGAEKIWFHPQLVVDFLTVEELGKKMLEELETCKQPRSE